MERTYLIHVDDEKVHFTSDGKVIFKREKNDYLHIVTLGMKHLRILNNEDGSSTEELTFPSNSFSLFLPNGSYTVTILYL